MLPEVNNINRQTIDIRYLAVGLQCDGSDSFSAITANPALGKAADILVQHGGTVILSETPEMADGASISIKRAINNSIEKKLHERLDWWKYYTEKHNTNIEPNPSPGNKAGGISTLAEKALGAIAKSGSSSLIDVYKYAEPIEKHGLVLMDSPGYDPVSITGQIASGANIICFTTGRGSTFSSKPAPCIELASNSGLYHYMQDDMDINCGEIIDGKVNIQEMGANIFTHIVKTASGEQTRSELLNLGDNEFTP